MDHLFDSLSMLLNGLLILCKKCLGSPHVWCTLDIQAGLTTEFLNHWVSVCSVRLSGLSLAATSTGPRLLQW